MTVDSAGTPAPVVDMDALRSFVGRVVTQEDVATLVPMRSMHVTFNRRDAAPVEGGVMPYGWHTSYFLPVIAPWELNPDGTPLDNGVVPEMPFPRRMHGGLKVKFVSDIRIGEAIRRENRFSGIEERKRGSGSLLVSTQTRSIYTARGLAVEEEYTLVHLPASPPAVAGGPAAPAKPGEPAPQAATWERTVTPDTINLFRFSALTFNAHKIHYDLAWARDVEGFPGVVVHGGYTAQCLLDLARDRLPGKRLTEFSFRAFSPLFGGQPIRLMAQYAQADRRVELFAITPSGHVAMKAQVLHD